MFKVLSLIFVLVFQTQTEKISVSSSVGKSTIKIGDKIKYMIEIEYDKSLKIEAPGSAINLGYFEIKDYKIHAPKEENGRISEIYEYTISTYDTGEYIIPPFPVAFFETENRSDFNYIEAPEQTIYVQSIFLNDSVVNAEPKPIKALKVVDREINWVLWSLLILAGVLIIGSLVWYFFIRKEIIPEKVITPLEAHEIALKELEKIKHFSSEDLYEINQFYTDLSMILRRYLEHRFNFSAVEQTTTELRDSLKNVDILSNDYEKLIELLPKADMVKFAKEIPPSDEFIADFNSIESFVKRSKFVPGEESDNE